MIGDSRGMRAVVLTAFGGPEVLRVGVVTAPRPADGELLVAVRACGVCGHDALARTGRLGGSLPRILGHEIAGEVREVGTGVTRFSPGDRVVLNQRWSCGNCRRCRTGRPNLCVDGRGFYGEDLAGGYAELVLAGEVNAVALPDNVPDVVAATLPCGVGAGLHALRRIGVKAGETVAVMGAGGGVGLNAVALAANIGAHVAGVTHRADKRPAILAAGAKLVVCSSENDAVGAVRTVFGGGVDAVVDCVGTPTFATAVRLLGRGGRIAVLGNVDPGEIHLRLGSAILREIEVVGSSHATTAELQAAVSLVSRGAVRPVTAATLELEEAAAAHTLLDAGTAAGRVVLRIGEARAR
jgi:acryloyl-coenzyme A reductase